MPLDVQGICCISIRGRGRRAIREEGISHIGLSQISLKLKSSFIESSGNSTFSDFSSFGYRDGGGGIESRQLSNGGNIIGSSTSDVERLATIGSKSKDWTLIKMDIIPAAPSPPEVVSANECISSDVPISTPRSSHESMIQHLGELMYTIFSQNKKKLHDFEALRCNAEPDKCTSSTETQDTPLEDKPSLFSNLFKTGEYPVSVCRLLSDMIDTGIGGKADTPFKTINEVTADLEQMSSHPNIFLYDADNDDGDFKVLFGERHYGQMNEISQLLSISAGMEASSPDNLPSASTPSEVVFIAGVAGCGKSLVRLLLIKFCLSCCVKNVSLIQTFVSSFY